MKGKISVDKTFMEMLVTRYSAYLGAKEVAKAKRKYAAKHYDTRKYTKELRKIYNDLITADDPREIQRLRARYIEIRKRISEIKEARDNDPVYQELKERVKGLNAGVKVLDELIVQKLAEYGYKVEPITEVEDLEAKIRKFNTNPRSTQVVAGEVKPVAR